MLSNSVGNRDHKIDFFFPRLSLVSSSQTKLDSTINTPLRSVSLRYNICVINPVKYYVFLRREYNSGICSLFHV